jgi:hypothetical protein
MSTFMGTAAMIASALTRSQIVQNMRDYCVEYQRAEFEEASEEKLEEAFQEIVVCSHILMFKSTDLTPEQLLNEIDKIEQATNLFIKPNNGN